MALRGISGPKEHEVTGVWEHYA